MEQLLARYGAVGIFLGAAFEGQTVVVIGGLLARQQLIPLWVALTSAAAGSAILDHLLFMAGRRFRSSRLVVRMSGATAFSRSMSFIERFPVSFTLAFRFFWGLRAAGPVALGVSSMPTALFTVLNILSAVIWAALFTGLGYVFGRAFEELLGHGTTALQRTVFGVGVLVVVVVAFLVIQRMLARRRARRARLSG